MDKEKTTSNMKGTDWSLQDSDTICRIFVDNEILGICIFDIETGEILQANNRFAEMYGYGKEELLSGMSAYSLSGEQQSIASVLKTASTGTGTVPVRFHRKKDKTLFPVEIVVKSCTLKDKMVMVAIVQDITERQHAEEMLKISKERYQALIEKTSDWIWEVDETGKYTYVSPQIKRLLGYDPQEIIGKTPFDLMPEDERERITAIFYDIIAGKKPFVSLENKNIHKDGHPVILETSGVPFFDENGAFRGYRGIDRDITERKKAEEMFQKNRANLLAILDNLPFLAWLKDAEGRFIAVNVPFAHSCGYSSPDELIGKTDIDIWPKHLAEKYRSDDLTVMRSRHKKAVEEVISDQGVDKWFETYKAPLFDIDGKVAGTTGFARDITERKKAEEELRISEERWLFALEGSGDGVWDWNIQTNEVFFSRRWKEMLGYKENEIGNSLDEWERRIHPDDKERVREETERHLRSETELYLSEHRILCSDGTYKWILDRGKVMTWTHDGKPLRMVGTHTDISERKRAEDALKESEEKYRLVVENANDAIFIAQDGILKFPTHRLTELSGYTADELTGRPFHYFLYPDDKAMVMDTHQKRLRGEKVLPAYSFRILNKEGEPVWVELSAVLITWEGRPATLNFLRNITIQKKLEEELLHSRKMEAIGTLAGGVAHDFNNLLMGILGYASLMLLKIDKAHPFYEKLKTIEGLVESGSELTKQLLGFARGGKYEVQPVHLNSLITQTADMFGRTRKEITIHKSLQKDLWLIEADRTQIEQVLMNLYMNAWQAMPSGGELYLETQNVSLTEEDMPRYDLERGTYVKITVTDTGSGMDAETQKRIFEPFFSTKGIGKGTGLGLASAYGIIKNHGGNIAVRSERGRGTTFTIYLPASAVKTSGTGASESKPRAGHETILIVDDEPINIEVLKELLEEFGYRVLTAQSGKRAVELYSGRPGEIQLVILDMIMPEMNGKETLLKLMELDKDVNVLLSSGYSIDGEAQTILDLGCKGFIQKPFRPEELSHKIREVLDQTV